MAKTKSDALAKADEGQSSAIKMAEQVELARDVFGEVFGDDVPFDVTGTEEMGAGDVRLPTWALNAKGNERVTPRMNEFFNTVSEETKTKLRLAILTNHKSRQWRENDKATNKPVVRCRSWDNETGEMEDGTMRPCNGCPDYEWRTDPETKKRSRRCGDVYNLIAVDRENGEVGVLRVKKAATKDFREYYQKFFHKKRRIPVTDPTTGKKRTIIQDYPFFGFETIVSSKIEKGDGFTWAVPVYELGGLLPHEEILAYRDLTFSYLDEQRDRFRATVDHADKSDADPDVEVVDTTGTPIDRSEFADHDLPNGGAAPAASSGGAKRF